MGKPKNGVEPSVVQTPPPVETPPVETVEEFDIVADFFEQYPNAEKVLKVGSNLYLPSFQGEAQYTARMLDCEVEHIVNPNL